MPINSHHPEYTKFKPDWDIVEDCRSERSVKAKGTVYLPATSGMILDGMKNDKQLGYQKYVAYLTRAVFPELVQITVNNLVGMMHRKPADIKVPKGMEALLDRATDEGESLQTLLRKINEAQLLKGRAGLLVDVPDGDATVLPYFTFFKAENIINWDESPRDDGRNRLDFVVIDESGAKRDGFDWKQETAFRLLDREPVSNNYRVRLIKAKVDGQGQLTGTTATQPGETVDEDDSGDVVIPQLAGKKLEEIPFTFIGSIDLTANPDQIPMLPLANLSLTIYRGEADYRQNLFMQAQDTLVVIGDGTEDEDGNPKQRKIGAGAVLNLPMGASAQFIGVSSEGLTEQKDALQNDYNRSRELGSSLVSSGEKGGKEAEGTIRIRVVARTASLMSIAKAGGEGLEDGLKNAAVLMGENPDDVIVTPNFDFVKDQVIPKDVLDLVQSKKQGAPLSNQSIHKFLKDHDMTVLEFDAEVKLIQKEIEEEEARNPAPDFPPIEPDEEEDEDEDINAA